MPFVAQFDGAADLDLTPAREDIVNHQIIRIGESLAVQIAQTTRHLREFLWMNSGDGIEIVELLHKGARRHDHMRLFAEQRNNSFWHGQREAECGTIRRLDDDVSAGTARARRVVTQNSTADANQRQYHGDLGTNGTDTEQGSHRTVLEIFEN